MASFFYEPPQSAVAKAITYYFGPCFSLPRRVISLELQVLKLLQIGKRMKDVSIRVSSAGRARSFPSPLTSLFPMLTLQACAHWSSCRSRVLVASVLQVYLCVSTHKETRQLHSESLFKYQHGEEKKKTHVCRENGL